MRAGCVICTETLDVRKPASAAKCGHVYHTTCLTEWIGKSRTCPLCRTRITIDDIVKLYFNVPLGSDFNISELETDNILTFRRLPSIDYVLSACRAAKDDALASIRELGLKVSHLKDELEFRDSELSVYRQVYEHISVSLRKKTEKFDDLQKAMLECESENRDLIAKAAESASEMEAKILRLEQINEKLYNDLEHLKNINIVVVGTQDDVKSILKEHAKNSGTTKQLATYCACLKRRLVSEMESKKALEESNAELKTAIHNIREKAQAGYVAASGMYEEQEEWKRPQRNLHIMD